MTGILIDIGYNNPRCFPFIMQLIAMYIPNLNENSQKKLFEKILEKLGTLSNIGLSEIWIQRVALGLKLKLDYNESLCKYAEGDHAQNIFNLNWISNKEIKNILNKFNYVEQSKIDNIKPKIRDDEINIFCYALILIHCQKINKQGRIWLRI